MHILTRVSSRNGSSLAGRNPARVVVGDGSCICSVYVQVEDAFEHMLTMVPAMVARILAVEDGVVVECSCVHAGHMLNQSLYRISTSHMLRASSAYAYLVVLMQREKQIATKKFSGICSACALMLLY